MNTNDSYRRGMAAYNAGKHDEAILLLEPLTGQAGATGLLSRFYLGQAHHQLALGHFKRMRFKEAASHFEAAARLNPAGGGVERFLAACYVKTGRLDLALDQLKAALDRDPDDVNTRIRLGLALWKSEEPAGAIGVIEDGLARTPTHPGLHYQLGIMHAGREEYAAAEECLARAIELDPAHVDAHERLAQCCAVRGDHQKSLELLQRAHALDPRNPRIGLQLSILAGMSAAARLVEPAQAGAADGLDRAAIDRLGEIIAEEPDFVDAFLSLPPSDVDQEVFSALAATLERALEHHPEYADLHCHCGAIYRRLGKHAAAIAHAEQAVRINPRFVTALILLGQLYSLTERWADSVERLQEAIRQGGDYPDVHYLLGRLYEKTGEAARARGAFERALVLNRDFQPATDALISLQAAQ